MLGPILVVGVVALLTGIYCLVRRARLDAKQRDRIRRRARERYLRLIREEQDRSRGAR